MEIEFSAAGHVYDVKTPWAARGLHPTDLRIHGGDRVLVTGPNGSGKSTMAWLVSGQIDPSEGSVRVGDGPASASLRSIGFLLQQTRLQILGTTVAAEADRFEMDPRRYELALQSLGFDETILPRKIDEMSLGQQRKVALAGLLARECGVLVLDEPLAGLDKRGIQQLVAAVGALPRSTTVMTITHDVDASAALGSRVISLSEGRVVADDVRKDDDSPT